MKKLFVLGLLIMLTAPAFAGSNSYGHTRPKWNGQVKVVAEQSGAAIDSAYIITRNIPTGWASLGLHIVTGDGGRFFSVTDSSGRGISQVLPFGSVVIWKPGYRAEKLEWKIGGDTVGVLGADGVLTFCLRRAVPRDRPAAALDVMEKLGASADLVEKWTIHSGVYPLRAELGRALRREFDKSFDGRGRRE